MASKLAEDIHKQFLFFGYQWKLSDGSTFVPTPENIDTTLDKAKELLYAEPVPSQLEIGRLIIRRYADRKFDVYLHQGDTND